MSQDIAALIIVLAAAVLPIAITLPTRRPRRRRYPGTVKASPGIRVRAAGVPRHFATGGRPHSPASGIWPPPALVGFAAEESVGEPDRPAPTSTGSSSPDVPMRDAPALSGHPPGAVDSHVNGRLHGEGGLSPHFAGFEVMQGACSFGQGEGAVECRFDLVRLDERGQLFKIGSTHQAEEHGQPLADKR